MWCSTNGLHSAKNFLQVNVRLSNPSGKTYMMISSRISIGRRVSAMIVLEIIIGDVSERCRGVDLFTWIEYLDVP